MDENTQQSQSGTQPDQSADAAAKATAEAASKVAADKAAADKAAADKTAADKTAQKPVAPEKYDFKAPEGEKIDEAIVGEFTGVAKELGLPQDQAQKVFDLGAKLVAKRNGELKKMVDDTRTEWETKSKADKEFGGEKLQENLGMAAKAIAAFGTPELKTVLNETGLGNHPELIRAFYRIGKAISGDRLVVGGNNPNPDADKGLVFSYPNSKHVS